MDNKEILLLIGQIKSSKACGTNSIAGNLLIEFCELLAYVSSSKGLCIDEYEVMRLPGFALLVVKV